MKQILDKTIESNSAVDLHTKICGVFDDVAFPKDNGSHFIANAFGFGVVVANTITMGPSSMPKNSDEVFCKNVQLYFRKLCIRVPVDGGIVRYEIYEDVLVSVSFEISMTHNEEGMRSFKNVCSIRIYAEKELINCKDLITAMKNINE